jgi:TonB-linked SusC/RagA family outer membrane protein
MSIRRVLLYISLLLSGLTSAQVIVTGTVSDAASGETLPGVQVMALRSASGTVTGLDGSFRIEIKNAEFSRDSLRFVLTGYEWLTLPVDGSERVDASLSEKVTELGEATVTAIGVRKEKKKLGYSVTDVTGEELNKSGELSVVNAINGKVAGVQVTSSSGSPGASSSIVIRGYSSIDGSNQPLFVIDGIPIDNSYRGSNLTDQGNRALDLNPEDIESISVLKGGAATALYGYRAGNGVVMITTKKGSQSKTRVSFSTATTFDEVNKLPGRQGRWSQGTGGAFAAGSQFNWGELLTTPSYSEGIRDFFQTGMTGQHNVAVEGGSATSSFHLSLGHTRQSGIIPNTDLVRSSVKLTAGQELWGKLKINALAAYTTSTANRGQRGSNLSGVMLGLMRAPSGYDLSNGFDDAEDVEAAYIQPDGTQRTYFENYDNPYWSVNRNGNENGVDRLIGGLELTWQLNEHWRILNRTGSDWYSDRVREYWDKQSNEFKDLGGRIFIDQIHYHSINNDLVLAYTGNPSSAIEVDALAGHNFYNTTESETFADGVGFVLDDFYDVSNVSAVDLLVDDNFSQERTVSAYGNLTLGYRKWLYLDMTARNDWFSTLPKQNNSVFYPSASAAIVFSEFLENSLPELGFGKLRVSYAETGNGAPAPYLTAAFFEQSGQIQGQLGYEPSSFVFNPDLRPERLQSFELGADLRFFSGRLTTDITWYNNNTIDQILFVPVPASSGYLETVFNAGNIRNTGLEVVLTAQLTRESETGLSWSSTVNFTRNRNEVESLAQGTDLIALPSYGLASTQSVVAVGQPYGMLYGGAWARDAAGNILVDELGYPIKDAERQLLGNPNPDFLAGWRNDLRWKNVMLTMLWDIRAGGFMHNGTRAVMLYHGTHIDTENRDTETIVWEGVNQTTGAPNNIPIALDEDFYSRYSLQYVSEAVMEEVNWVRLRDLSITYNLPAAMCKKLHTRNLSVSLTSRNLFLWTTYSGIDPETNLSGAANSIGRDYFNSPNTRSYGFVIRASF